MLRLAIKSQDNLKLDYYAFSPLKMPKRTKVLLVTPGNEPLTIALTTKSAQEIAEVQLESPDFSKDKAKYQGPAAAGAYDLVIF